MTKEMRNRISRLRYNTIATKDKELIDEIEELLDREGSWLQTEAYPHWVYCSNCMQRFVHNSEWIEQYDIPTNYCPNCGAKMTKGDLK